MKKTNYLKEQKFLLKTIKEAYKHFPKRKKLVCMDKASFDIVTTTDYTIEKFIIEKIKNKFPNDNILSEETLNTTSILDRTWTIDPIDGTFNMANNMPLFGIQCSMYDKGEPVVAVIYLPLLSEMYYATKGCGAFLNNKQIFTNFTSLDKSIVSFGDFPHLRADDTKKEQEIIKEIYNHIARVRMFGAASIDFAYLASGKINGTFIFTKNKWDISPGILLCKEAGAILKGNHGDYTFDSNVVIAVSNNEIYDCIKDIL